MPSVFTLGPTVATITAGTTAVVVMSSSLIAPVTEWVLQNQGTAAVYIGRSTVTTSAGFLLASGDTLRFNAQKKGKDSTPFATYGLDNYYVITAATGNKLVLYYDEILNRGS